MTFRVLQGHSSNNAHDHDHHNNHRQRKSHAYHKNDAASHGSCNDGGVVDGKCDGGPNRPSGSSAHVCHGCGGSGGT